MNNGFAFIGGEQGIWEVTRMSSFRGAGLDAVTRIDVVNDAFSEPPPGTAWVLQGLTSNLRYANRAELDVLKQRQPIIGRPEAKCAALIPIK